jgi:hypothetical protein
MNKETLFCMTMLLGNKKKTLSFKPNYHKDNKYSTIEKVFWLHQVTNYLIVWLELVYPQMQQHVQQDVW